MENKEFYKNNQELFENKIISKGKYETENAKKLK